MPSSIGKRGTPLLVVLLASGCANNPPQISTIEVSPDPVATSASLTCTATDPDGDELTYTWLMGGVEVARGNPATWTSPGIPGVVEARVLVSDGTDTATDSRRVNVNSQSPWPRLRHGLQATGRSSVDTSGNKGVATLIMDDIWSDSSPAIGADGTVYVGDGARLLAFRPDRSLKWKSPALSANKNHSSPAVAADGTIYVGGDEVEEPYRGRLYALNPADGSIKWFFSVEGHIINSSPAIGADGTIYFGGFSDGKFYAVRPNGTLKWAHETFANHDLASPTLAPDGTIYVGTTASRVDAPGKSLLAFAPDGRLKWTFTTGDIVPRSPAVGADGTVYFNSLDDHLYAVTPEGKLKWKYKTRDAEIWSAPAIGADGVIYFGSSVGENEFHAVNPDGTLKWRIGTHSGTGASAVVGGDGTVYAVGVKGGAVTAHDPATGEIKWETEFLYGGDSSLAIGANGEIYYKSERGFWVIR